MLWPLVTVAAVGAMDMLASVADVAVVGFDGVGFAGLLPPPPHPVNSKAAYSHAKTIPPLFIFIATLQ